MQLVVCLLVNVFPEHVCLFKAAYAPSQARLSFSISAPEDPQRSNEHLLALPILAQLDCNRNVTPSTSAHPDELNALPLHLRAIHVGRAIIIILLRHQQSL